MWHRQSGKELPTLSPTRRDENAWTILVFV
jgi:hypothetical protein